ncbi:ThiF family adenylyltransferase, partial [Escherichia coli]|nr:ThiF family adenylyltransferase [Escherichia coli]
EGQEALKQASVLMLGAGGLGCASSQYLATAGVGKITLIDDDIVELSNLQRQVLHHDADIGRKKVESAADALRELNPHIIV